ncbi:MAG: nitroreductase family protein, partial [Coriobacteriia bacterium]|nr:nitroreductase family protein [Coriobacteriia bacterium]
FSHRKKLEERFKNNPEIVEETMEFSRAMGGARTIVLAFLLKPTYSEEDMPSCIESVAAAMNTLCLAAYDKGVASCWVEELKRVDEQARARFCPDKGALLGGVVLGYPAMEARPIRRKPGRIDIR